MLFHYSVPGFICRKERSSGFDQRKNKGRRRSLFQRPPSIILSSSSLSLSLSLTTIHHLVLILFTLAPHLEVERSRDLLCGLYLDRSKWNLFLALHLFVPSRCIFHETIPWKKNCSKLSEFKVSDAQLWPILHFQSSTSAKGKSEFSADIAHCCAIFLLSSWANS